ncbi:fatty acid desaturase family protein [Aegicerativicinus sediminis]|uniref:fatty acid desaturase family protein n=1 Tax=Aegicerativicinus sediminis TaxID=2893202 RepID=UPI001E4A1B8C|nr:acyl-CoA desaturase [Aegicerativicinus sediminis]
MNGNTLNEISFPVNNSSNFMRELRLNVNNYFTKNNISKKANSEMIFKTFLVLLMYFVPYLFIILNVITNPIAIFLTWMVMAIGMTSIYFVIGHDANHGNYSTNRTINKLLSNLTILVGGSSLVWRIQHNILHHVYTNIEEHDEDLYVLPILRFSPLQKRKKLHRYQGIYAWILYCLFTLSWTTRKDFIKLNGYKAKKLIKTQNTTYTKALLFLIFSKIIYFILFLILPIILNNQPWTFTLMCFITMHMICGFLLSIMFQLAHKVMEVSIHVPDEEGQIDTDWASHQLRTTANFATKNRIISWFTGGINFQIEHHLFPDICHVHFPEISKIVKRVTDKYKLPYNELSFLQAIKSHQKFLVTLGNYDDL